MPALLDSIFLLVRQANLETEGTVSDSGPNVVKPTKPAQKPSVDAGETPTGQQEIVDGSKQPDNAEGTQGQEGTAEPKENGTNAASDFAQSAGRNKSDIGGPSEGYGGSRNPWVLAAMALLGAIVGGAVGNFVLDLFSRVAHRWDDMEIGDKVSLFLGVFAGIVASLPFQVVFQGLGNTLAPLLTFFLVVAFSGISIFALKSMEEVLPWQRNSGPRRKTGKKILDTNVIIDGRILDVVRSGFLEGDIIVPKFVIEELQHIADSSDALRRQRGRRGLEVLKILQADYGLVVDEGNEKLANMEVDAMLVMLAKSLGGDLVSNDFNLNKVASLQDVRVLNLNDLALSLRSNILPGERLRVAVIREGNQPGQGVGYLDDGTMVVIEDGRAHIGENVELNVTQVIQTERGKMIFGDSPTPCNGNRNKGRV